MELECQYACLCIVLSYCLFLLCTLIISYINSLYSGCCGLEHSFSDSVASADDLWAYKVLLICICQHSVGSGCQVNDSRLLATFDLRELQKASGYNWTVNTSRGVFALNVCGPVSSRCQFGSVGACLVQNGSAVNVGQYTATVAILALLRMSLYSDDILWLWHIWQFLAKVTHTSNLCKETCASDICKCHTTHLKVETIAG